MQTEFTGPCAVAEPGRLVAVLVTLVAAAFLAVAVGRAASATDTSFLAEYVAPQSPEFVDMELALRNERFLEGIATILDEHFALPRPARLSIGECGEANAFYDPDARRVLFCYELLVELARLTAGQPNTEDLLSGAIGFILLHEVGHALIHGLQLPVVGREEDAADQFATLAFLEDPEGAQEIAGALIWLASQVRGNRRFTLAELADEHALSEQRLLNTLCWMYGRDPFGYVTVVASGALPGERAARCGIEYTQMRASWYTLLGKNLKKKLDSD